MTGHCTSTARAARITSLLDSPLPPEPVAADGGGDPGGSGGRLISAYFRKQTVRDQRYLAVHDSSQRSGPRLPR